MAEEYMSIEEYQEPYDSEESVSSYVMESKSRSSSQAKIRDDDETDVKGETIIAFTREVTKRLEMERKHEYDMLKLKYEHEMEMKTKNWCNMM